MRGGTLFSGIGAPEVAAPWIDWRWSADIDDFANAVRAHHWPDVPNLGDVGAIDLDAIEPVDIVVFGSPCQSFSVAGKRLGLDDPRGNLALVALGLVAAVRPRWVVFENVPGLLSSDEGRDFQAFVRTFTECGYSLSWRVLDAQFAGVPQRRRRVFAVGHLGDDWRPSAAVLLEPESLRGNPPPSRETGEDVAPTISARPTGGGGLGTDFDLDDGLTTYALGSHAGAVDGGQTNESHASGGPVGLGVSEEVAYSLRSGRTQAICATGHHTHALTAEGHDASEDGTGRGTPVIAFSAKDHGGDAGATSPTLRAMGHADSHMNGGGQVAVAWDFHQITAPINRQNRKPGDPCHTLARDNAEKATITCGPMVRRLTPTECERLQGFEDGFTDIPWRGKRAPDSRRYRALGNSMAVPVVKWVLDQIGTYHATRIAAE